MKSILTMAWTAEDPSAFDLAAKLARTFDAKLVGLEPPSYGVMSMAWADAGMGAPIGGGPRHAHDAIGGRLQADQLGIEGPRQLRGEIERGRVFSRPGHCQN